MRAVFFSDVHLMGDGTDHTRDFLSFLEKQAESADQINLVGDVFDVWPSTNRYLIHRHRRTIDLLAGFAKEGRCVNFFEGNHDFHLGAYFRQIGINVFPDHGEFDLGGRKVYVAHGDLGNPDDHVYRAFRRLTRTTLARLALKITPGAVLQQLGSSASNMSRQLSVNDEPHLESVRGIYRSFADSIFARGYDVVILGHTHIRDHYSTILSGRSCEYFNIGDWVRTFSFVEFDGERFYTRSR